MNEIYIVGVGGFAKEVFFLIEEVNKYSKQFDFRGFIDKGQNNKTFSIGNKKYKIFEEDDFLIQNKDRRNELHLAMGIGNPKLLKKLSEKFNGFTFPNLIHPNFVGHLKSIKLGKGNIITAGCIFTTDIEVGSFNIFNLNITLGHDSIIGDCNVINPGVNISGGAEVGDTNLIGTGATILQYLKVGSDSVLGAASLLTKELSSYKLAMGVPAKVIRDLH